MHLFATRPSVGLLLSTLLLVASPAWSALPAGPANGQAAVLIVVAGPTAQSGDGTGSTATAASEGSPSAEREAMDRGRLQTMLVDGDTGMVMATFKRYPGAVLPFIDSYFEGGLAMIEKEGDAAADKAKASFRMGIKFAKLADEALGSKSFSAYANAFASWSPTEQKQFREGQRLFREGMKLAKTDRAKALASLEESLTIATKLGDLWGQGMALSGLAEVQFAGDGADRLAQAQSRAQQAIFIYEPLSMQDDLIDLHRLAGRACVESKNAGGAYQHLDAAWSMVSGSGRDAATKLAVAKEFRAALEGNTSPSARNRVESLDAEIAKLEGKAPPAAAPASPKS